MQTRFEESRRAEDEVHARLTAELATVQAAVHGSNSVSKMAELEARMSIGERDRIELKSDIYDRLNRIEAKLDRALQ